MSRRASTGVHLIPAWIAGALLCLLACTASAQQFQSGPTGPATPAPAAPPAPSPNYQPGFLDAIGRLFSNSVEGMKDVQGTVGDLGGHARDAASDAASAVIKLPNTRVLTGRARCPVAGNGAPDCQQAVNDVCRQHGLEGGRMLEIQTAEECPSRAWLSGRRPEPGECKVATYVTRALCQ